MIAIVALVAIIILASVFVFGGLLLVGAGLADVAEEALVPSSTRRRALALADPAPRLAPPSGRRTRQSPAGQPSPGSAIGSSGPASDATRGPALLTLGGTPSE
jgi:hypothetical protein